MLTLVALFACGTPETAHEDHADHHAADASAKQDHGEEAHGEAGHHGTPAAVASQDGWNHYGEAFSLTSAKPCAEITADPQASVDQVVRVQGHIENVCQKAGCWMVVADDDGKYLRITMKEHAFGVPTDTKTGAGTQVDVEGKLIAKTLDAKTLEHLKSEAKGTPEEVAAQLAPKFEIIATGVAIKAM